MRVLLTGASGFIGKHVLRQLQRCGVETVVIGRTCPADYGGEYLKANLLETESIEAVIQNTRATHLLHLAWYVEHGKYWNSPVNLRWVESTVRLVEAFCSAGGQHVVVAGTCAEYDWAEGYCREDESSLEPKTLYGATKDATRRLIFATCADRDVPCAWGRLFLPYGGDEDKRRLLPSLFEVFNGQRAPFGVNAAAYRDFLNVLDVSQAFVRIMETRSAGCYNISSGEPIRISEVVHLIAAACNGDPNLVLDLASERPGEPSLLVGDNSKLKALGWRSTIALREFVATNMVGIALPRPLT